MSTSLERSSLCLNFLRARRRYFAARTNGKRTHTNRISREKGSRPESATTFAGTLTTVPPPIMEVTRCTSLRGRLAEPTSTDGNRPEGCSLSPPLVTVEFSGEFLPMAEDEVEPRPKPLVRRKVYPIKLAFE